MPRTLISLIFTLLWLAKDAQAIVWRADLGGAPQGKAVAEMRNAVAIHYTKIRFLGGSGVQLTERWVLTTRHAVKNWMPRQMQIRRGEHRMSVKRIVLHPDKSVDLALLELADPIPLPQPLSLASNAGKAGARLWLGGFGKHGAAGSAGKAGVFIAGYNRLEKIDGKRGKIVFDPPGKRADPAEALPARFDSGSPVFIERNGNWLLFGVTVTASNSKNPTYGDRSDHQLLATERAWLDKTVPALVWTKP